MKSTAELLKSLGLEKSTSNVKVAKNYLNVLNLINEVKNDIVKVEILDFEEIKPGPSRSSYAKDYSMEYYKIFGVQNLKTVRIETTFGSYNICVPINTNFYSYLCVILKIQSTYVKPVENVKVENTIYIETAINDSITKSLKFTDTKYMVEFSKCIYLHFQNGFVEVLSTNNAVLYKSQKYHFISDNKIDNLILSIPLEAAPDFKTAKNEFLKIDLIDSEFILINDYKTELSKVDSQKLLAFNFEVDQVMQFSKVDFQKNVRSLKGFLDYQKMIKFHLNGSIQMQPINESNKSNTTLKMDYLSKDFSDMDYTFGFDNITKIIANFKAKELVFSPKVNNNNQMALITDSVDSILIVNNTKK